MSFEIVEVAPRDGLQNESRLMPTEMKVELVRRQVDAGVRRIEVTSFVHPERVPQMADAEAVVADLPHVDGVRYIGLALNQRGVDRALAAGLDEVNFVVVATDTFNQRNQGTTTHGSIAEFHRIAETVRAAGARPTVTIAAAFGCPFEGDVPQGRVVDVARRVLEAGPAEVALADTIGVGVPSQVHDLLGAVAALAPDVPLRCHFHNTRNIGLANAWAAVEAGVQALDASLGGIGGCPFAPAATGNIPTEDVAYMLARAGRDATLDLPMLIDNYDWLTEQMGMSLPGLLGRAGIFPPPEANPRDDT